MMLFTEAEDSAGAAGAAGAGASAVGGAAMERRTSSGDSGNRVDGGWKVVENVSLWRDDLDGFMHSGIAV